MNNDRLKFRVWADGTMYMPDTDSDTPFALNQHGSLIKSNDGQSYYWARIAHNERVVEQCTGLKDKNGNLIYAGDKGILTVFGGIGPNGGYVDSDKQVNAQVEWVDECAGFYFIDDNGIYYDMTNSIETFEIIGNVHEQKEQQ